MPETKQDALKNITKAYSDSDMHKAMNYRLICDFVNIHGTSFQISYKERAKRPSLTLLL